MALVITIAADVEPQAQLPSEDVAKSCASNVLNDSGHGSFSSQISFIYPGELLSDDEFFLEFSSSCSSSRRSSNGVASCNGELPPAAISSIPTPPPLPPLPRHFRSSVLYLPTSGNSIGDECILCHCEAGVHIRECCSQVICEKCYREAMVTEIHRYGMVRKWQCPNPDCKKRDESRDPDDRESIYYYDPDISEYEYEAEVEEKAEAEAEEKAECIVCYSEAERSGNTRKCCSQVVCSSCIREIVHTNIEGEGNIHILCPNPDCKDGVITKDTVIGHISGLTKEKYNRLRLQESMDSNRKTCPNCCFITEHRLPGRFRRYREKNVMITCSQCQFVWCFHCHAPWHHDITCKEFLRGDKHFKRWRTSKSSTGAANCQKCPLCRVPIQRSTGCDHMTCNRCSTEFCYKCGGLYNGFPGLGNHYKNTSIFGCKYSYKANKPVQRKAIRGGYLGAKLAMLTGYPVLFVAGLAVAVVVGAVALPIYGGYRYYKFKKRTSRRHH